MKTYIHTTIPLVGKTALILLLLGLLASCENQLDVGLPPNSLPGERVFDDDATALAAMDGVFHLLQTNGFASGDRESSLHLGALSAGELIEYGESPNRKAFYEHNLQANNPLNREIWQSAYESIYRVNAILEGLAASSELSPEVVDRLKGEASFVRAYAYFYLVNFYGEVPLVTTTDREVNAQLPRESIEKVYTQIQEDLEQSRTLLPVDYAHNGGEKTRPIRWSATALLARVKLYNEEWEEAATLAGEVIEEGPYTLAPPEEVFLAQSPGAIWQLLPTDPYLTTWEGYYHILTSAPDAPLVPASTALDADLLSSFENNDLRVQDWIAVFEGSDENYPYPYKYTVKQEGGGTEYSLRLRFGEQYLIRAEARANLGQDLLARQDLESLRTRAGLTDALPALSGEALLEEIADERYRELFTEGAHRWFDLKRTGRIDEVMNSQIENWQAYKRYYPIPEQELFNNTQLTQNEGY